MSKLIFSLFLVALTQVLSLATQVEISLQDHGQEVSINHSGWGEIRYFLEDSDGNFIQPVDTKILSINEPGLYVLNSESVTNICYASRAMFYVGPGVLKVNLRLEISCE